MRINNVYFYSLCDGEIKEYKGYINADYRYIFCEENGKEIPHFGKVAKEEGKIFMDSIWFYEQKTVHEVINEFLKNYGSRIERYNSGIKSTNEKINLLCNIIETINQGGDER